MDIQRVKDFFKKFFDSYFIKTPLTAIGILLFFILFFFVFLHVFSRHGKGFPIPDFTGISLHEAQNLASKNKLRLEVVDSVYIITRLPGAVVEQNPSEGTFVKANRRVFVTTNAVSPMLVEMPNVVGLSLRQARSLLNLQGFRVSHLSFVPDIAINNVLEQHYQGKEIATGHKIPKGSEISLVLGKGFSNEKTVLPRVIGLSLSEARNLLLDASLNIGRFTFDATVIDHSDSLQAKVYSQYPNPIGETSINFGARVDLWLTINESRIPQEPKPERNKDIQSPVYQEPEEEILE